MPPLITLATLCKLRKTRLWIYRYIDTEFIFIYFPFKYRLSMENSTEMFLWSYYSMLAILKVWRSCSNTSAILPNVIKGNFLRFLTVYLNSVFIFNNRKHTCLLVYGKFNENTVWLIFFCFCQLPLFHLIKCED